ncbi:sulfotransferase 6B1-like isoform X1 [Branchiostoma floridae x Branchiostoma japonicum]
MTNTPERMATPPYVFPGPDLPYTEWRGIQFLCLVTRDNLESIQNFQFKDGDVVIIGFPKTGTHWMRQIVHKTMYGKGERCNEHNDYVLEFTWPNRLPCQEELSGVASPRLMVTYLSRDLVSRGLAQPSKKIKVLVVMRNPKDVCVSFYHWSIKSNFFKTPESWDSFQADFLAGKLSRGSYYDHLLGWWQMRDDPHFLFVKYEDLKKRMCSSVKRMAEFLDQPLSDADVQSILQSCSFDAPSEPGTPLSYIKRKGVVGDWKNIFTEPQSEAFDKHFREKFGGTGLEFEYD